MKHIHKMTFLLFVVALTFSSAYAAPQSATIELVVGMRLERTLTSGDKHVYTVKLDNGAAIIAEADQQGIDLIIDVIGPNGQLITQLDSPNGNQGPEKIDITSFQSGPYKFIIRTLKNDADTGQYVMIVQQMLGLEENSKRIAKKEYPTQTLYDLWIASQTDTNAVDEFVSKRKGKPIIEPIPGNASDMRVTHFWLADQKTEYVIYSGGPDFNGMRMQRLGKTNLFFVRQVVSSEAHFVYAFNQYNVNRAGPNGEIETQQRIFSGLLTLKMPNTPKSPYIAAKENVPMGEVISTSVKSNFLNKDQTVTVYTPAGYDSNKAYNLLIVLDGREYSAAPNQGPTTDAWVPTPTILDNLVYEKKINPTIAIMVWNMDDKRETVLPSKAFADFIADEVVPWARSNYSIHPGPSNVFVAGASRGGFAATNISFTHPETVGNVLSQSGSYWITKKIMQHELEKASFYPNQYVYPRETGMMIETFKNSKRLPIRFYMDIGLYEDGAAMLGTNRQLRDVLQLKGYDVDYREFYADHGFQSWRSRLSVGLISLLGRKVP